MMSGPSWSAGYEKTVSWGARYAGLGGAAVGAVTGAESTFFNPAGLVRGKKTEISLNISPYWGRYRAPMIRSYSVETSRKKITPIGGILVGHILPNRWAIGAGLYSVGGNKVEYGPLDYGVNHGNFNTLRPRLTSDFQISEFSLGLGIPLGSEQRWSVGLGWRLSSFKSELDLPASTGTVVLHTQYAGLSDKNFSGFRLGVQYRPVKNHWGLGASYRSGVKFIMKGRSSGEFESILGGTVTKMTGGGEVVVTNNLPWQLNTGGFYQFKKLGIHGEYSFTHYSANKTYLIQGDPLFISTTNVINSLVQNWRDQHALKLGAEIPLNSAWDIRAGHAITSQVVGNGHARASTSSPAWGFSYVLGAGYKTKRWSIDCALDYSHARDIENSADTGQKGEFSSKAMSLNTTGKLFF